MEIERAHDVVVLVRDLSFPVRLTTIMTQNGWPGGQGVKWAASGSDDFTVTFSDGEVAAFLLRGSDESADQFSAYTNNQPTYKFGVACCGTWIMTTSTFERYTLQSRLVPPLVQNVYVPGTRLLFSLRGYFTPQDEWTISVDPRAPNKFWVGTVVQAPTANNNNYLTVEAIL